MDGYRPPDTAGEALCILEGKNLSKAAHIQPGFTGTSGVFLPILDALQTGGGSLAQTSKAVGAPILRLNKDGVPHILHPIADFPLDAYIGNLTEAVQVGTGAVAVQRIAVAVGSGYGNQCYKIDFILQDAHLFFLLTVFGFVGCVQGFFLQIVAK